MAQVLIVGCGDVGIALGRMLIRDGHTVWGMRRQVQLVSTPLSAVSGDVTDPLSLRHLPQVEYVFYLVAAQDYSDTAYRAAYSEGPSNVLKALHQQGQSVRRFLFVSSTGVYGQQDGAWVDETAATEPNHFSGKRLLQGEHAAQVGPFPTTVVRFGGIYGPGRRRLIERVLAGTPCIAEPPLYTNRIHRDDCAGALRHLMTLEEPAPLYLGVDNEPAAECVVMDWLAHLLGVVPPLRTKKTSGHKGLQRANKRCSNARLRACGYRFRYPTYREGYRAVLKGVQGAGNQ